MSYCCRRIPVPVMVLAFLLLFSGCGSLSRGNTVELEPVTASVETQAGEEAPSSGQTPAPEKESEPETLSVWVVHICGAVNRPGVYTFPEGSRVCDAVEAAGGLSEEAAANSLNQAALLSDGLQIVVPTEEELEGLSSRTASSGVFSSGIYSADGVQSAAGSGDGLVNINTASLEELMTLPGIGQTRAEAIVTYRQERGSFQTIEDIMKVDGIKEGSFEKLKEKITV